MEFQRASQGKEILMPRTGGSTTRATRLSRVRGASTQRQTVGSAIRPTEDAGGQWRIIEEKSGSTVFFDRWGDAILGSILVFLYMVFLVGGV